MASTSLGCCQRRKRLHQHHSVVASQEKRLPSTQPALRWRAPRKRVFPGTSVNTSDHNHTHTHSQNNCLSSNNNKSSNSSSSNINTRMCSLRIRRHLFPPLHPSLQLGQSTLRMAAHGTPCTPQWTPLRATCACSCVVLRPSASLRRGGSGDGSEEGRGGVVGKAYGKRLLPCSTLRLLFS